MIYGTDFATAHVGEALVPILEREAPHVVLRFEHVYGDVITGAPASLRDCDGVFLPHGYLRDCPHLDVLVDRWVCLVSSDNSRVGERPSVDELLALQWVSILDGRRALTPPGMQLRIAGAAPTVSVITPNFFVIPMLVAKTERVALVQESFARRVVASMDTVRMVESPFMLEPIREAFWWHPDREDEPAHVWLRARIAAAVAGTLEPA
jgi:DNA-binding transcriptional LysR family regulator